MCTHRRSSRHVVDQFHADEYMTRFYCFPSFVRVLLVDLNVYVGRLWSPLWNLNVAGRANCGTAEGLWLQRGRGLAQPSGRSGCVLSFVVCCLLLSAVLCCAVLPFLPVPPVPPVRSWWIDSRRTTSVGVTKIQKFNRRGMP